MFRTTTPVGHMYRIVPPLLTEVIVYQVPGRVSGRTLSIIN